MMNIVLLILGILLLALSIYLCVKPHIPAVIAAYGGIWMLQWSEFLAFPSVMLTYWGIMVMFVLIIVTMLPQNLVKATQGTTHITLASLCGMLSGATLGYASLIIGAFVGAAVGGVIFARTPKGAGLNFPSSRFLQYVCAKGLPAIIAISLVGIAIIVAAKEY